MAKTSKASAKRARPASPGPPPVPIAVSPSASNSSVREDISNMDGEDHYGPSISHAASPVAAPAVHDDIDEMEDVITCQWEECGVVFGHLPTLIDHIHNDHIGVHKSNYTCEWASCLRRGLPQTSRFALISHIRSHTGEKPFICPLPECDKSFTRSDALAKHMRLQHNISPPAPGRGGSRKRKRGAADELTQGTSTPVASTTTSLPPALPDVTGFVAFKVDPHTPSEAVDETGDYFGASAKGRANGRSRRPARGAQPPAASPEEEEEEGYESTASDILPSSLLLRYDESTGLVLGRTPAKAMYLLMKAKHRYVLEQQEQLQEQLQIAKNEAKKEMEIKEHVLDDLLQRMLGPDAAILMSPRAGANDQPPTSHMIPIVHHPGGPR